MKWTDRHLDLNMAEIGFAFDSWGEKNILWASSRCEIWCNDSFPAESEKSGVMTHTHSPHITFSFLRSLSFESGILIPGSKKQDPTGDVHPSTSFSSSRQRDEARGIEEGRREVKSGILKD